MKGKMTGETFLKLCLLIMGVLTPSVGAGEWTASVVRNMDALVSSCVVVPCSFSHPKESLPTARLRGQWHRSNDRDQLIFYKDSTRVLENFRGRTRLLGELGKGNCSLEINNIKSHDNGPFCFRIELARTETDTQTVDKFSFVEDCVTLQMMSEPNAPSLTHKDPIQGRPFTITCSVTHTCPTSKPKLTWSRGSADEVTESHREIHRGLWEVSSVLAFVPAEKDDHQEVTCTALFQGEKMTSSSKMTLYVKRSENYNYIIVPLAVALGSAAIFGGLCFLMVKKYNLDALMRTCLVFVRALSHAQRPDRKRIEELQRQDGTLFNRLSRISRRIRTPRENPPGQRPKNNGDEAISKPRFPSPKSKPRASAFTGDTCDGDDYMNAADLNVYGNV